MKKFHFVEKKAVLELIYAIGKLLILLGLIAFIIFGIKTFINLKDTKNETIKNSKIEFTNGYSNNIKEAINAETYQEFKDKMNKAKAYLQKYENQINSNDSYARWYKEFLDEVDSINILDDIDKNSFELLKMAIEDKYYSKFGHTEAEIPKNIERINLNDDSRKIVEKYDKLIYYIMFSIFCLSIITIIVKKSFKKSS